MRLIKERLANLADAGAAEELRHAFKSLYQNQCLKVAGAAIKTTSSPTVKYANQIQALVGGRLVTKAAGDFAALNGSAVAAGESQIWIFGIDGAGTLTTHAGQASADAAKVKPPALPKGVVAVAALYVTNGTASAFTPATTALDAANITAVYVDIDGPFFPI